MIEGMLSRATRGVRSRNAERAVAARGEGQVIKNEVVARNVSEVLGIHVPHLLEISFGEERGRGERGVEERGEDRGEKRNLQLN